MKSAVSLVSIASLVGSGLPVAAQDRTGPLTRAVTREAVRLAEVRQNQSVEPGWASLSKLAPGTEVVLTVKGSQPARRYFVLADGSELTVLNLTDPTLPPGAARALLNAASTYPQYFASGHSEAWSLSKNDDVRIGPAGVFMGNRKVADLGRIVEKIGRTDVVVIRAVRQGRSTGARIRLGVAIGAAVAGGLALIALLRYHNCGCG